MRLADSGPTIVMEVVRGSDPDTVEASFPDFRLLSAEYDALFVEGELGLELNGEPFPSASFDPARFPGLF